MLLQNKPNLISSIFSKKSVLKIQNTLFFVFFIACFSCFGNSSSQDIVGSRAKDQFWLDLLYYDSGIFGGWESKVITSTFFLSPNGKVDPEAELRATISAAYLSPKNDTSGKHALCKFPARILWLKEQGLLDESRLPKVRCKLLEQWKSVSDPKSISVVYAAGFLKNPASYFGHLFLKMNKFPVNSDQNLLNATVNYGADIQNDQIGFMYALKGLLGGYDAYYSQNDFFSQNIIYGFFELRDIWEFELSLTDREKKYLVLRMWEMFTERFNYYFINENCAYFIVEPLEKQLGVSMMPRHLPYSLPRDVINKISKIKRKDGSELIKQVHYIPSRQTTFFNKYQALTGPEKNAFMKIIKDEKFIFNNLEYKQLVTTSKKKLLEVLLDYVAYLYIGGGSTPDEKEKYHRVLKERYRLPLYEEGDYKFEPIVVLPPNEAPGSAVLSVGASLNERVDILNYKFRIRAANHDFLTSNIGRAPNSYLTVMDLQVATDLKKIWVDQLDLINIQALNNSTTGLPGDGDFAWGIQAYYGDDQYGCNDCKAYMLAGDVGYSFGNNASLAIPYAMTGLQLQSEVDSSGYFLSKSRAGLLFNKVEYFAFWLEGGLKYWIDGEREYNYFSSAKVKIAPFSPWDLRLHYLYEVDHAIEFEFRTYW